MTPRSRKQFDESNAGESDMPNAYPGSSVRDAEPMAFNIPAAWARLDLGRWTGRAATVILVLAMSLISMQGWRAALGEVLPILALFALAFALDLAIVAVVRDVRRQWFVAGGALALLFMLNVFGTCLGLRQIEADLRRDAHSAELKIMREQLAELDRREQQILRSLNALRPVASDGLGPLGRRAQLEIYNAEVARAQPLLDDLASRRDDLIANPPEPPAHPAWAVLLVAALLEALKVALISLMFGGPGPPKSPSQRHRPGSPSRGTGFSAAGAVAAIGALAASGLAPPDAPVRTLPSGDVSGLINRAPTGRTTQASKIERAAAPDADRQEAERLRRMEGLSIREIARCIGRPRSTVGDWLKGTGPGRRSPDVPLG